MSASDQEYYGRVMSVNMLTFSLMPIGSFVMGYIIDGIGTVTIGPLELMGVQMAYVGAGAIITVFIFAVTLLNPSYRKLEQNDLVGFAASTAEGMRREPASAGRRD